MNEVLEIIGRGYVLYAMAGVFFVGVISRFYLNSVYHNIHEDVFDLPSPKSKVIKQIKLKYESCNELGMQISNTEAFVRKNMYEYKICGVSLRAIEKILGQSMFFEMLVGITVTIFLLRLHTEEGLVILHIGVMALFVALLYDYDRLSDISYKRQLVETGIIDFLENHFSMHFVSQEVEEEQSVRQTGNVVGFVCCNGQKEDKNVCLDKNELGEKTTKKEDEIDNNIIIEEVLREFFG